ncbi:unnamed protein product [Alternaria alternata]
MFERHPNRTLSLYNVCRSVRYPKGHDKIDWRQYAPGLKLWPCVTLQEGFKNVDRKYVLQDACTGTQGYLLGKLDSGVIDFEILRRWLGYCKRHHTECTQTYNSSIPGLKVIDCATGKAIHAPEDTAFHYVALSYVWGGTRSSGKDKDEFPATIHDAITVTVQLGYKYLWVDQYCINQLAGGHKQAQIQLMGRIYSEAELVIIAAAGDSSDYGLPGVGVRAREAQRRTRLDNDVEFIEMNKPDNELRSSTWAQRGWTYQEGYLATRRLVFTDKEVLYVCNQGAWQESVQRPAMENDSHYLTMANEFFPGTSLSPYRSHRRVYRFLENYSARELSYDNDILNACTGVLNKLVSHHFWGMVAPQLDINSCTPLSLVWRSLNPGQRRQGFPSWSWVATTGPKTINSCDWEDPNEGYVAHIRTTDGRWLSAEEQTNSRCDPIPMNFGPTLRLRGTLYTGLLSTHTEYGAPETHGTESDTESEYERDNERDDEPVVVFQATDGDSGEIEIVFNLLLDIKLTGSDLKNDIKAVLILGSTKGYRTIEEYENGGDPVFMILQVVGDHYKRIGITDYKNICWILEKKTGKMRTNDFTIKLSYDACRGSEQFIYIE